MFDWHEKFMFEFNDAVHSAGIIPEGSYVDGLSLLLIVVVDILATILIFKYMQTKKEQIDKYVPAITIFVLMATLIFFEAYLEILIALLFAGLYFIIENNDKYIKIRKIIDKLF
jgi:hypothetical protein